MITVTNYRQVSNIAVHHLDRPLWSSIIIIITVIIIITIIIIMIIKE